MVQVEQERDRMREHEGEGAFAEKVPISFRVQKMPLIEALKLDMINGRLQRKPPHGRGLTKDEAEQVVEWYRMFLYLRCRYQKLVLMPPVIVQVAWEQHILHTMSYREDCLRLFPSDGFLEYEPSFAVNNAKERHEMYLRVTELYKTEFENEWKGWIIHLLTDEERGWETERLQNESS